MITSRPGPLVWVAALLPLLPPLCALAVYPVPEGVIRLDGEWRVHNGDVRNGESVYVDESRWPTFRIPGGWSQTDAQMSTVWLRRRFDLPKDMVGRDLFLIVGHTRDSFASVYVNGQLVGEKAVPSTLKRIEQSAVDGFVVPKALLQETDNVIAMKMLMIGKSHTGLDDKRFLLGPPEIAKTYFLYNAATKNFLEFGALLLIIFASGLVAYLWLVSNDENANRLYRATLLMQGAGAFYLMGKTGMPLSFFLDGTQVGELIAYAVLFIGAATPEFVETYYVGRATTFRLVNRVVCASAFVVSLIFGADVIYIWISRWLLVVVAHALFYSLRDIVKPKTRLGPVFASAMVVAALCGANDLLTDIDVWYTPRLFTFGVGDLSIMVGAVVIAEFLKLTQSVAESARLKSEFLANTSHELRTPLNAIINIPQGILEQFEEKTVVRCQACETMFDLEGGSLDPNERCPSCDASELVVEVRKFAPDDANALAMHLQTVVGAGQHLLSVVDDILDFSKLDAGRMRLTLAPTKVADVVQRAVDTVASIAQKNDVELKVAPIDPALIVTADEIRLRQIMMNLLSNAVKLSPPGTSVDVSAIRDGSHAVLSVRDRGPGIAPENQEMIFESFRQVESGHTRKHGGTGLGLAIVKRLVDLHNGTIHVDSELGKGATFSVRIPISAGS